MPLGPGRCVPAHLHEALLEAALFSLNYPPEPEGCRRARADL